MSCVRIQKLRKEFGKVVAVDDVEFSFFPGQVHGFIGPNGAGKTTTMRILATLEQPTCGDATVMGFSVVNDTLEVRRKIGFVPDWFVGFASTTVHEYLDFFARACFLTGRKRTATVGEIEEFTGLAPLRDKLITELSRGMQQRVCLGRSLVNNPDVLLMDEPAANLDPRARIELRELVKALAGRKKAVLISSHILSELSEMCDSVTIIDRGKLLVSGAIKEIQKSIRLHITIAVRALCSEEILKKALLESPGAANVRASGKEFLFDFQGDENGIAGILRSLVERGISVVECKIREGGLEDIFMKMTDGRGNGKNKEKPLTVHR